MADISGVDTTKLKLTLAQNRVILLPGQNTEQQLTLANYSGILDNFELNTEGLPAEWFSFSRATLNLFPNWSETVELNIFIAPDITPGLYHLTVKAVSASQPEIQTEAELLIEVRAAESPAYPGSGLPDYYQIQASSIPQTQPETGNNQPWFNQLGAYSPNNGTTNGQPSTNGHQYQTPGAGSAQPGPEVGPQWVAPAGLQDRPTTKVYQAPPNPALSQNTAPLQAIPAAVIPPALDAEPAALPQTEIAEPQPEAVEETEMADLIDDISTARPSLNRELASEPDLTAEAATEPALETPPKLEQTLEVTSEPEPPTLEPRPRLKIQTAGLQLEADTNRLVCLPGSHTEQQIGLVNLTSRPDLFDLTVEGLAANWYSFSYSQLNLFPHWSEEVYFRVDLPADAPSGLYPARLVATALGQPQVKAEINFELEVPAFYSPGTATPGYSQPEKAEIESGQLELTVEQPSLSLLPGHTAEQQVSLTNLTNLTGTINLSIEGLAPGWYSFSTASLNLFPGWQEELYLRIQVPATARAGFYPARLVAATVHGTLPPAEIPFELEVQALPQPAEPLPTPALPEDEPAELPLSEPEVAYQAPLTVFNPPAPEPAAAADFWNDASPAQPAQASALSLFARAAAQDEDELAEVDSQPTVQFNYGDYISNYRPPAPPQPDYYRPPEPAAPAPFRQPPVTVAPAPDQGWPREVAQAPTTPNPPVALWQPATTPVPQVENHAPPPATRTAANIQVTLETDRMTVVAGSADEQQIKLMNMTSLPDDFDLVIEGLPANWYSFSASSLNLFPNWMESIQLKIELSPKVRPNSYPGKLIVTSRNQPGVRTEAHLTVEVLAPLKVEARVQPNKAKGFKASYDLILRNRSMSEGLMTLELSPETQFCQASFQPPQVLLPARQSTTVKMKVNLRPKTPRDQAQQIQPFEVAIKPQWRIGPEIVTTPEVTAGAEYIHESRWAFIGRHPWLFGLATLLLIVILLWSWLILPAIRTGLISSVDRFDFSGAAGKSIRVEQGDFTGRVQSQVPLIGSFVQLEVRFTEQDQKATVYIRSFFLSADLKGSLQINPKGNLVFVPDKPGQPTSFPWTFAPPTQVVDKINSRLRTWLGSQNLGMDKVEIEGNTLFIRLKTCKTTDPGCN